MTAIFDLMLYDTDTATILAHDAYHDGKNWERGGTNTYLYRTPQKKLFFMQYLTTKQGDESYLKPLSLSDAVTLYHRLREKEFPFEKMFPGITIENA